MWPLGSIIKIVIKIQLSEQAELAQCCGLCNLTEVDKMDALETPVQEPCNLWFDIFWIEEPPPAPIKHITATCLLFDTHSSKRVTVLLPHPNASLSSPFGALCAYLLLIHRPAHAKCMRAKYMCCLLFHETTPGLLSLPAREDCFPALCIFDGQPTLLSWLGFLCAVRKRRHFKVSCNLWMIKWLNNIFKGPHLSLLRILAGSRCCDFNTKVLRKTNNIKSKSFSHVNVTAITLSQAVWLQCTSLRFTSMSAHYRDLIEGVILWNVDVIYKYTYLYRLIIAENKVQWENMRHSLRDGDVQTTAVVLYQVKQLPESQLPILCFHEAFRWAQRRILH